VISGRIWGVRRESACFRFVVTYATKGRKGKLEKKISKMYL